MTKQEIVERLGKIFSFRFGEEVHTLRKAAEERGSEQNPKFVMAYRLQLTNGAVVDLGTASEMLNFRKVQAAFAESYGHVIPSKESKNWDEAAQLLFDLHEEVIHNPEKDEEAKAED